MAKAVLLFNLFFFNFKAMQTKLIGSSFLIAPLLMFASDLIALLGKDQFYWASSILFWLSFYCFLFLIFGMLQLSNFSKYATISSMIAAFGALIGITIIGMSRFAWALEMEGVAPDVITSADSRPWVFFTSRFPGITFPIGLILLAIPLKKNNFISRNAFIGLVISILLFPLGRIPKELILNVAGDGLMIFFFGLVGKAYLKKMTPIQRNILKEA